MLTELYPYQVEGVDFMYNNPRCLNLDDPGLGKTGQAIGLIERCNVPALVVVKAENLLQWRSEFKKFSDMPVGEITAKSKKARAKQYANFPTSGNQVLLLNYNKGVYDYHELRKIMSHFGLVIFDEAFALKAPNSQQKENFEDLTEGIERVVAMTATPIGMTLYDIYNIMRVCHIPGLISEESFMTNFLIMGTVACKMGYRSYRRFPKVEGSQNIDLFVEMYGDYFIKRENTEHLKGITPLVHQHPLKMTFEQLDAHQELKVAFQSQTYETEKPISTIQVYSKCAQIVDCPSLIDAERYSDDSPKAKELVSFLKTGERAVVYAKYIGFHKVLMKYFDREGISYVTVSGQSSSVQKDKAKQDFNAGKVQVLLMSKAGKEGLNLQTANHLFLMDAVSSPSDVQQFLGRIYRDGQKASTVHLHFVYMLNSLEENSLGGLYNVQEVIDRVFDENKAPMFATCPKVDKIVSFLAKDYTH